MHEVLVCFTGEEGIRVCSDDGETCSPGGLVMPVPIEGSSQPSNDNTKIMIITMIAK